MGWLGWSEEQTLYADLNAITIGYRGRVRMINAMLGGSKRGNEFRAPLTSTSSGLTPGTAVTKSGQARPLTPAAFDAIFGASRPRKFIVPAKGAVKEAR